MYNTYALGFDPGNSETSIVIMNGEQQQLSLPSYTAIGSLATLNERGYTLRKDDYVYRDNDTVDTFVGELALRQSRMQESRRGDSGRYWNRQSLVLLLVASSAIIPDREYGLHIVTGLPTEVYISSPENKRKVKKALEGEHRFTINGGYERIAHVTVERVIIEGAGATIAYGLHKAKQGVIDIGGFTTDLFASQGQEPLTHLCDGRDLGVEMVGELTNEIVNSKYGRRLDKDETRYVLRKYASSRGKIDGLYANGTEITNLRDVVEQSVDIIGRQIAAFLATTWNDSKRGETASSFAKVLLIGGGSFFFLPHVRDVIPNAERVKEPEYANAAGYCQMAEHALNRLRG